MTDLEKHILVALEDLPPEERREFLEMLGGGKATPGLEGLDELLEPLEEDLELLGLQALEKMEAFYRAAKQPLEADRIRNDRAVLLLEMDRPQEALELLQGLPERLQKQGQYFGAALAWGNLGNALERLKRYKEAEQAYRHCIALWKEHAPDTPENREMLAEVYRGLAAVLLLQEQPREALTWMGKAMLLHPRNPLERFIAWGIRLITSTTS